MLFFNNLANKELPCQGVVYINPKIKLLVYLAMDIDTTVTSLQDEY